MDLANKDLTILHYLAGKLMLETLVKICDFELRSKFKHLCTYCETARGNGKSIIDESSDSWANSTVPPVLK